MLGARLLAAPTLHAPLTAEARVPSRAACSSPGHQPISRTLGSPKRVSAPRFHVLGPAILRASLKRALTLLL